MLTKPDSHHMWSIMSESVLVIGLCRRRAWNSLQFQSEGQAIEQGHWTENRVNAPEGGDPVTPQEEIPVENRNQVSTLVRTSVLDSETGDLGPVKAAVRSLWIGCCVLGQWIGWYKLKWNMIYLLSQLCLAGELWGNDLISYICHVDQWSVL